MPETAAPPDEGMTTAGRGDGGAVPVLVLGLSPTGLVAIRTLARRGVPVWGADVRSYQPGRFSRYCRHADGIARASRSRDPDLIVEELVAFADRFDARPVLFLTNDTYIELLDDRYGDLERSYRLTTDWARFGRRLIDKRNFARLCSDHDVPVPTTHYVSTLSEVREAAAQVRYPAILKPVFINHFYRVLGGKKVVRAETADDLVSAFQRLSAVDARFLVQEVIPGPDRSIAVAACYYDRESRPRSVFVGRKLRQHPPRFGSACLAESEWIEEVAEESLRFLGSIGFRGIGCTEFKYDGRDGVYKMIETNPRLSLWNGLAVASGVDFVSLAYRDLTGHEVTPSNLQKHPSSSSQRDGMKWIFAATDVRSAFYYWRRGELSVRDWAESLRGIDSEALLSMDDLGVLAAVPALGLKSAKRALTT